MKFNSRIKKELVTKVVTFENDKKESPLYKALASQRDKRKGLMIIQHLKNFFGINDYDLKIHMKREMVENGKHKIKWTRDEKGNIISPFSKKLKSKENEKPK